MISLQEIAAKLFRERKVAVFCHMRPDGDSVGSVLALCRALNNAGVSAKAFCCDVIPQKFDYLEESGGISSVVTDTDFSAYVAVDCADQTRLGVFAETFCAFKNTYNIDHHVSNTRFAKYNYVVDSASNCENIFNIIKEAGIKPDGVIANELATGVVTDTGNFNHKNVTASTFFTAGELYALGADFNKIAYKNFHSQSKQRAKLFGMTMSRLRFFHDDKFALATVTLADIAACEAKPENTEGFIDFVMGIEGVSVGACVMETEKNVYKISLRSKGPDVNLIAGTFGGGGHVLAAGCRLGGAYEEVVDKLQFAVGRCL